MKTHIKKWGNSYAIRVPAMLVRELGLQEDSAVSIERRDDTIVIQHDDKDEQLARLLENMREAEEIDWGSDRGKERW